MLTKTAKGHYIKLDTIEYIAPAQACPGDKWAARVTMDNNNIHDLSVHDTEEEATQAIADFVRDNDLDDDSWF